jgi:hypothetical protein
MSDDALPAERSRSDGDEELFVEADHPVDAIRRDDDAGLDVIDADLALREAGGDADRAEEILEAQRQAHDQRYEVPADERPA